MPTEDDRTLPPESRWETSEHTPALVRVDPASAEVPRIPGYEVGERLGQGGMGAVYRAREVKLKREVALKVLLGEASADAVGRFRREAEAVARLQHPGIVQVFEVGEYEGRPYFAMELVKGGSLDARLGGTPLAGEAAAKLVEALARAVQAAHDAGIVHRDLKPANVLLTSDTTYKSHESYKSYDGPKISDFGLAKQTDDDSAMTRTGAILGTPSYMAPEQAEAKKDVGPSCDIWALGAILYECLTGRPPFRAATPLDTILQVVSADPVPPRRLVPGVPRDLETVALKCLEKQPARRYASAAALADDLKRFLDGEPIRARPVGALGRASRWCRRNPLVASLSLALLLFGVAAAGVFAAQYLKIRRQYARSQQLTTLALSAVDRLVQADVERFGLAKLGLTDERRRQLEDGLRLCQTFLQDESDDAETRLDRARTWSRVAAIELLLGRIPESLAAAEKSLARFEAARTQADPLDVAQATLMLKHALSFSGRAAEGEAAGLEALRAAESVAEATPTNERAWRLIGEACRHLGGMEARRGRLAEAEKWHRRDLAANERFAALRPGPEAECCVAMGQINVGMMCLNMGRLPEAEKLLTEADERLRRLGDDRLEYQAMRASALQCLFAVHARKGSAAGAEKVARELAALGEEQAARTPAFASYLNSLYVTLDARLQGRPNWYGEILDSGVKALGPIHRRHPNSVEVRQALGAALRLRALRFARPAKRHADAARHVEQAVGLLDVPALASIRETYRLHLAHDLIRLGRIDEALRAADQAPMDAAHIQMAAALYAAAVAAEPKHSDAGRRSDRAMALVRQIASPQLVAWLKTNPDLAPLRGRADFQLLLKKLEAKK